MTKSLLYLFFFLSYILVLFEVVHLDYCSVCV